MSDSKPPVKLTDEQLALAEETAVRTAEEITGRKRLTEAERAALQAPDQPDDRVAAQPRRVDDRVIGDRTTFTWGAVALFLAAALSIGGMLWQTNAIAEDAKTTKTEVRGKADANDVAAIEARVRVLEQGQAASLAEQKTAHEAIKNDLSDVKADLKTLIRASKK